MSTEKLHAALREIADPTEAPDYLSADGVIGWTAGYDACRMKMRRILSAPAADQAEPHSDDLAVDTFAVAMKEKLAKSRAKGRGGWDDDDRCHTFFLAQLLVEHIDKGDPVDVANFAMMLHQRSADPAELILAARLHSARPLAAAAQPDPKTQDDDAWLLIHRQREALLHGKQEPFDPARMPQEVQQAYDAAQAMLEATEPLDVPEFLRASSYQAKLDMSPQSQPASEPVAWWNGFRQNDDPDSPYGPSISWRGENSAHDIPLFSGWNPESELMRELVSLRAAAPRINEGSKHQSIESAADKPSENAAPIAEYREAECNAGAICIGCDPMPDECRAAPPAAGGDDYQAVMSNIEDQVAAGRMGAAIVFTKMRELVIAALRERVS